MIENMKENASQRQNNEQRRSPHKREENRLFEVAPAHQPGAGHSVRVHSVADPVCLNLCET